MITIFVGTNRPKSNSMVIAQLYQSSVQARGEECQLLNMADLPLDFMTTECFGNRSEGYQNIITKFVEQADKYVFVLPEYHGGFPGIIKSFLDSISGDLVKGKVAGLVGLSSGRAGNLRGLDAFAGVLGYLQVEVLSNKPKLSNIESILADGVLDSKEGMDRIENQIDQLINW